VQKIILHRVLEKVNMLLIYMGQISTNQDFITDLVLLVNVRYASVNLNIFELENNYSEKELLVYPQSDNTVGLKRAQISAETIRILKKAFKILFHSGLSKSSALEKISNEFEICPELEHLIFFAKTSERGLC